MEHRTDPDPGLVFLAVAAWLLVAAGGTLALIFAEGAVLWTVWAGLFLCSIGLVVGGAVEAVRDELPDIDEARTMILEWRRRHGHQPDPLESADVPFSDDEYEQMRKRIPFIGIVRSEHTDTSEIMSNVSEPTRSLPISLGASAAAAIAKSQPEHRQKA